MKENILRNFDFHGFFVRYIPDIPNKTGWVSCCSPFRKDDKPSFSINLHHGGWKDFATGESGNFWDFVQRAEHIHDFKEQLKFVHSLGANVPVHERKNGNKPLEPIPKDVIDSYCINLQNDVYNEITRQLKKRCISKKTCAELKIGSTLKKFKDNKNDVFYDYQSFFIPYNFDEAGNCTNYKFIPYNEGNKVNAFIRVKGGATIFPQSNLIFPELILCEGELDALTLNSNGFKAVTGTAGAGTFTNEMANLFNKKAVTILYDNDKAGNDGAVKVAKMLDGIAKTIKIADWNNNVDHYDAGDYFQENDNIDVLISIIEHATPYVQKKAEKKIIELNYQKEIERKKREVFNIFYKKTERGFKLIHSEVATWIIKAKEYPICSTLPDPSSSRRLFYFYKEGIWQLVNRDFIKMIVINLLSLSYTDYEINQIVNLIGTLSSVEPTLFNSRNDLINLRNCTFDLLNFKVLEHSPDFFFTHKNDYDYNPAATCPEFSKSLEYYSKDKDGITDLKWISGFWEVLGYCLTGYYEIHKMFWFFGSQGGEGKSTLTRIMSKIVGPELTKPNLDPDQLSGQFYKGSLIGKRLAITGELPSFVNNVETIKQLTGEDEQSTDVKFKDHVNFKNAAKLVFSMNRLPSFPSSSPLKPILRRIYLLPFQNPIKKLDSTIENKFQLELSGIFNLAIEGLQRLRKQRNKFTVCHRAISIIEQWSKETNPVTQFINETLIEDKKSSVWAWQVWDAYCKHMNEHSAGNWANDKVNPSTTTALSRTLRMFLNFYSGPPEYCYEKGGKYIKWYGISFKARDIEPAQFDNKEKGYFGD